MKYSIRVIQLLCILFALSACVPVKQAPAVDEHVYQHAAVAADHGVASQAGLEILQQGGNAVDAAVATSFCLSVVRPYSCGIGGGGFMLIYIPGERDGQSKAVALNYRETAPAAIVRNYYVDLNRPDASRYGAHAAGVPGSVAGLLYALEQFGTLDRKTVLAPAIRAAEEGFQADANYVQAETLRISQHHSTGNMLYDSKTNNDRIQIGDIVRNPAQAKALRLIAAHGVDGFYRGPVAEAIVKEMRRRDGPITENDLVSYTIDVTNPLVGEFAGRRMLTMPPPSSGGVAMLQVLGIIAHLTSDRAVSFNDFSLNDPHYVHYLTESFKHAFADRAEWLADDAFVDVPVEELTHPDYLRELAGRIEPDMTLKAFEYGTVAPGADDAGTSHFCVIDESGMAVSCTETINLVYGSGVYISEFGFYLNNEMNDFTTIPGKPNAFGLRQSDNNLPEPGKRPLSSMSPTIALDSNGMVELIAGASGGPRIITGTLQAMLNCLVFDKSPRESVSAPRFHHQWLPNILQFEDQWIDEAVFDRVELFGHKVGKRDTVGKVQMIHINEHGIRAASDPRKGGEPAGY